MRVILLAFLATCLMTACAPPPSSLDVRTEGDWRLERSLTYPPGRYEDGHAGYPGRLTYSTYYKGVLVSRQAFLEENGKPIAADWVRPPAAMANDPRMNPLGYFQSRVRADIDANEAVLRARYGKPGQETKCGSNANCQYVKEQVRLDRSRLDNDSILVARINRHAGSWPTGSEARQAEWPTEGRRPAMAEEGGRPGVPPLHMQNGPLGIPTQPTPVIAPVTVPGYSHP